MTRTLVGLLLLAAFAGAAQQKKGDKQEPPASAPAQQADRNTAQPEISAAVDLKTFVIGPEDVLSIKVWREPELSSYAKVRVDGKISVPLAGEIVAAGRTPVQLSEDITKALAGFVNNPLVMVAVYEVYSRKFSITGEVARPGSFPLITPTTVLEALIKAGGFKDYAKKKKITVLRKGVVLKFNYEDVVKGKKQEQNIQLEDGDLIVVP
jgi:polysaccharide biosynthesis/export protein